MEYQERHSPCSISSQLSTLQAKLTKLPWWCIVELVMSYIYSLWSILLLTLYILFYTSIVWIRWWTLLINVAGCFFNFLNRHDELSCVCVLLLLDQSVNTDIDMCWLHVGEWYTCRPICICAYTVAVTIVSPLTLFTTSLQNERLQPLHQFTTLWFHEINDALCNCYSYCLPAHAKTAH